MATHPISGPKRTVRRKKLVLGVLAIASATAIGLSGCTSGGSGAAAPDPNKKITLSFWGSVPNEAKSVAIWNKAHPNIHVDLHQETGDDGSKVPAAVDAGTGPDIAQVSQHSLPDYVINKRAINIAPYIKNTKNLYTPAAWSSVQFGDAIYGVPQDSGPAGLLYRTDIFKKYGLTPPATWDDYVADAQKLHAANPSIYLGQFSPAEFGMYYQTMVQAGGSWYGISGNSWKVSVNDAGNQKVAALWQGLLDQKLLKVVQMWTPEYWKDVDSGQIASISYAAWFPQLLKQNAAKLSGKWAVAPEPTFAGSTAGGESGGAAMVVLKGTKYPKQAAEFSSWFDSNKASVDILVSQGGLFPAAKIGLQSPTLDQADPYFGGEKVFSVFKAAALISPDTAQNGPGFDKLTSDLADQFGKVASGSETFAQALDSVQASTVANLKSQGLSVK
ncbi:MAG TPA: extracellular solute-binding protein [Galbitalea sp.]